MHGTSLGLRFTSVTLTIGDYSYRKNGIQELLRRDLDKSAVENNLIPCASSGTWYQEKQGHQQDLQMGLSWS